MPTAMAGKVSHHSRTGALAHRAAITRLAITAEQVTEHDLPRKPIDTTDDVPDAYKTRVEEWQQEHGGGAVELNVLEANIDLFQSIVYEGVSEYRDPDLITKKEDAIDEWQANAEAIIRSTLQEHREELDEQLAEAAAWCEEFNAALVDAKEHFDALRELTDDPRFTQWNFDTWATPVRGDPAPDQPDGITDQLPTPDVPEGEAPFPDDPLFDTTRSRMENVRRADPDRALDGDE